MCSTLTTLPNASAMIVSSRVIHEDKDGWDLRYDYSHPHCVVLFFINVTTAISNNKHTAPSSQ